MTRTRPTKKQSARDRVLIIEGNTPFDEGLDPALTRAGFSVAHMPGYPQELVNLDVFKPDMVILDETLADCVVVCRHLHAALGIPVVLVGGDSSQQIWKKALLDAEADFYLRRPFSYQVLVARIKAILRRYKRRGDRAREHSRLDSNGQFSLYTKSNSDVGVAGGGSEEVPEDLLRSTGMRKLPNL